MGTMQRTGMRQPLHVVGHSAGGPGSVGAVYHAPNEACRTAAAFAAGPDEGITEDDVLRQLAGMASRSAMPGFVRVDVLSLLIRIGLPPVSVGAF